jgi:hypothetical protein
LPDDSFTRVKGLRRTFVIRRALGFLKVRKNILVLSFLKMSTKGR